MAVRPEKGNMVLNQYEVEHILCEDLVYQWSLARDHDSGEQVKLQVLVTDCAEPELEQLYDYFDSLRQIGRQGVVKPTSSLARRDFPLVLVYNANDLMPGERMINADAAEGNDVWEQLGVILHAVRGKGLVHGYVAPRNIAVYGGRTALTGFGYAPLLVSGNEAALAVCGEFVPPEAVSERIITALADVYSLGRSVAALRPGIADTDWYKRATADDPDDRSARVIDVVQELAHELSRPIESDSGQTLLATPVQEETAKSQQDILPALDSTEIETKPSAPAHDADQAYPSPAREDPVEVTSVSNVDTAPPMEHSDIAAGRPAEHGNPGANSIGRAQRPLHDDSIANKHACSGPGIKCQDAAILAQVTPVPPERRTALPLMIGFAVVLAAIVVVWIGRSTGDGKPGPSSASQVSAPQPEGRPTVGRGLPGFSITPTPAVTSSSPNTVDRKQLDGGTWASGPADPPGRRQPRSPGALGSDRDAVSQKTGGTGHTDTKDGKSLPNNRGNISGGSVTSGTQTTSSGASAGGPGAVSGGSTGGSPTSAGPPDTIQPDAPDTY